jgi:hypothetical protein
LEASDSILKTLRREKSDAAFSTRNEQFDPALFPIAEILICGDLEASVQRCAEAPQVPDSSRCVL